MPPTSQSPLLRRKRLGGDLRKLREAAGLTGDQVIERIGWASASKLSRLENGRSRPDLRDVNDLLNLYEVDESTREDLLTIAREAGNMREWLKSFRVMTEQQRPFAELEAGCAEIREYCPVLVPGLLQTAAYARVRIQSTLVLARDGESDDAAAETAEIEREVAARISRQSLLDGSVDSTRYTAIIEETALGRRSGPAEVIREQLLQLCDWATLPNVSLHILPRDAPIADWYIPPTGFSLYRFTDPLDPETLAIEGEYMNQLTSDKNNLNRYRLVFEWLHSAALSAEDSLDWLKYAASWPAGPSTPGAYGTATAPAQRNRNTGSLTDR